MVAPPRLTPALALVAAIALASPAGAQGPETAEAPSEEIAPGLEPIRPWFVSVGIGTGVRLDGFAGAALRIVEEAGVHFEGTPVGPFLAVMLAEDIAGHYSMLIGVRVGWDLELLRSDVSIVVSPSVGIAFAFDVLGPSTYAYFDVQPALGIAVLLLERMLGIWIRPIGVDVYVGEAVHGGWAAVAGATLAL